MSQILPATSASAPAAETVPLHIQHLGRLDYTVALEKQRELHAARIAGAVDDTLLLLEHPPVYTLGRRSDPVHILMSETFLAAQGATIVHNERGGEVTYHGPGQLMAYPIIQLRSHERSLTLLVDRMEETVIRVLAEFGLVGRRDSSDRGVWIAERKVASIGMSVRRWVVMHGIGLNVSTDLRYFDYINPCGHSDLRMTSICRELDREVSLSAVAQVFARHFAAVFGRAEAPQ